ncbi:putative ABC transporter permease protein [Gottschalkia acidurici 9a]|uniref:ABC transporter permease protein n=1 Tax=Gottschalkia acidurici (strain ATCC 7906 / DSM 604 / BCRC 14475 / CIP 104303 / KCTC 5404 / NCIMB 10678 / 9a) TaxID=1128398 RepID=K0B0S0_GOTA9|nr:FtsX-like permease family protein [Gottschalkia acidurici]AFS79119.1 putative ABC transporter permease protein [Gottschalkia acidurici 9a]
MKIIIKFLLLNIKEKKFRTFLILLSITLSTALLFASIGMSENITEMYLEQMQKKIGSAEIIIYPNKDSPSPKLRSNKAYKYIEDLDYIIENSNEMVTFEHSKEEKIVFDLQGFNIEDLQNMNPITIEEEYNLQPFNGKKIIIDSKTAEKYDLKLGSTLNVKADNHKYNFTVSAIASTSGILTPGSQSNTAIVPIETINDLFGEKGKASRIYIKTKDSGNIDNLLEKLSEEYRRYEVKQTITQEDITQHTDMISKPFMLMLALVIFISIFVIYTSFKVISMERMPLIGTFRSIGATKRITDFLLLMESAVYGVLGGVLGCGLGYLILYGMINVLATDPYQSEKMEVNMVITLGQFIISFFGAIILSFISSILPIVKVSKVSVRDIVLNTYEDKKERKGIKTVLGLVLFIISMITPLFIPMKVALIVDSICLILISLSLILLIPFITDKFILLFELIYSYTFGNIGIIAVKNLRDNKGVMNNIALLTIGIASLLMINTLSYSVGIEVLDVYSDGKFDIMLYHPEGNKNVEQRLRSIEGVISTYGVYEANNIKVLEQGEEISSAIGIDQNKYFDYWDFNIGKDQKSVLKNFDSDRNIILSSFLKNKLGVKEDDYINLEMERGSRNYRIVGFVDTLMYNGNIALLPERYLKLDMKVQNYSDIYLKSSHNPEEVMKKIKEKFNRENIWGMTLNQLQIDNMQQNNQLFILLKGFSIMSMIIGIFGVLNNFVVSFLSRKRSMAVMRSVGMSKTQITKMLYIEALTGGIIGGITGALGGLSFVFISPYILMGMNLPIKMHYSPSMFVVATISSIIITVIASVSPSFKSTRLNIIESIKYE